MSEEELKELIELVQEYQHYFGDDSYAIHVAEFLRKLFLRKGLISEDL